MMLSTVQQTMNEAMTAHQAGRLAEAEALFLRVLQQEPNSAQAHHLLGLVLHQMGKTPAGIDRLRQALALAPQVAEFHSNLGVLLLSQNQCQQAAGEFALALRHKAAFPAAQHNLGLAMYAMGMLDEAERAQRSAIELQGDHAAAHSELGNILCEKGQYDQSIKMLRRALNIKPNFPEAQTRLGTALYKLGNLAGAETAYRTAVAQNPNAVEAMSNLSVLLKEFGRIEEAIALAQQAVSIRPQFSQGWNSLGMALRENGQTTKAAVAFQRALAISPVYAEAMLNLGNCFTDTGRVDEALIWYERAVSVRSGMPEAQYNLGTNHLARRKIDRALDALGRAVSLRPNYPEAWNNLGNALKCAGRLDEAIACFQKTGTREGHDNWVYSLLFHPNYDDTAIAAALADWNHRYAEPLKDQIRPHDNGRSADRKLRIGYVSPDFRRHVVGMHLSPLLREHDKEQFEIYCYSDVARPDAVTEQLRRSADQWRDTRQLTDQQLAEQIRADRIDIVVDLTQHMAGSRLLALARKPAPVQAAYLGYCGSTGVPAIDYRISDPYLDPIDAPPSPYCEQIVRLSGSYWCYQPPEEAPQPQPLETKQITFGSLNQFVKASAPALDCWRKLLDAVPNSRLILRCDPGEHAQLLRKRFADRVEFVDQQPWPQYIRTYDRVDVCLDPFPYGGGITTFDSLYMGVPVVTLRGRTAVGRGGCTILNHLNLPDLIADNPESYIKIAVNLAVDVSRRSELRQMLRAQLQSSILMDAGSFARDMEKAYRGIWRRWCEAAR